jgi:hypothetical protein
MAKRQRLYQNKGDGMTMRSDNFPDDFSGDLPGEKIIECDICGKLISEGETEYAPTNLRIINIHHLLHPSLICKQCFSELEAEQ